MSEQRYVLVPVDALETLWEKIRTTYGQSISGQNHRVALEDARNLLDALLSAAERADVERVAAALYVAHVDSPRVTVDMWPIEGNPRSTENFRRLARAAIRALTGESE